MAGRYRGDEKYGGGFGAGRLVYRGAMRIGTAAFLVLLVACGGPSAPAEPAAAPTASVAPVPQSARTEVTAPVVSAAPPAKDPEPSKSTARFKVTTAMGMEGKVDDKALVAETNAQVEKVSACAPIVRKTDHVVGSINLKIAIAKDGTTKPELQSPVSDEAKTCILDAVGKWKLSQKVGAGSAMVLLSFVE